VTRGLSDVALHMTKTEIEQLLASLRIPFAIVANVSTGTFIGVVRFGLRWDNEKFVCLCWAMHAAAKQRRGDSVLPRDLSQLFWYCGTFMPMWIDQSAFRVGQPAIDYDRALRVLKLLGNEWFGEGELVSDAEIANELEAIQRVGS
jgi:hypothetical protein